MCGRLTRLSPPLAEFLPILSVASFTVIKKLKGQLEERQKNIRLDTLHPEDGVLQNGTDVHVLSVRGDANRQISDLKFKLAKSEQEITALEQNVRAHF
ncbi:hypothetical protein Celaphus_00002811 [Cervus elaphus hippelaphus]|uniref:Uncharacterized protein n=1 Tax=Cervus elaphus hippelaphus TaxID=46360 RepID=A0A212CFV9_CEREH|nr:hypothetical protein Celaphus_00002811 [Cervus elaphus hippelaphus]